MYEINIEIKAVRIYFTQFVIFNLPMIKIKINLIKK